MNSKGFLLVELLIAGVIITSAIAASYYMVRNGLVYIDKIEKSNVIQSKLPFVFNFLKSVELMEGVYTFSDGTDLKWKFILVNKSRPQINIDEINLYSNFEIYLYKVEFTLNYKGLDRTYFVFITKYKRFGSGEDIF
jgi:hypothetical protein